MRTVVTGASGFVGGAVVERLLRDPASEVVASSSRPADSWPTAARLRFVPAPRLSQDADWRSAFNGAQAVIHLAARVHIMRDTATDPLSEFRRINVAGSIELARQAAAAGVKRFVYVSSIKVHGEWSQPGRPFTADDTPAPIDPYGVSKLEAENALRELSERTGMELTIVRPPLIYGPGVHANFLSLIGWLHRGVPLPLGAIDNRRSLVGLENLSDLLALCAQHPSAAGQTFLAADGEDVSTTVLLRRMAAALGRRALLLPVPAALLEAGCAVLGKRDVALRLCSSLQADTTKTRQMLGWAPPESMDAALARTARWYLSEVARGER